MAEIREVAVRLFSVPLAEPLYDDAHGRHDKFELVTVTLTAEDGSSGTGYTYTGGKGGRAIHALIVHELSSVLIGQHAERTALLNQLMEKHMHYIARGGIAAFAISAVDIALWDLKLKRWSVPLWRAVGGHAAKARCYRGGIDLGFTTEQLVASVRAHVASGHNAVKIKIGRDDDVARVVAVRAAIGDDATLMLDANMAYSVARAVGVAREMVRAGVRLHWFEEPTAPGDYAGNARVRSEGGIALAQGENLHTLEEFRHAIVAGAVDFPQPDASNCGGISGWLAVAALCRAHGLSASSHGAQELHCSLVAGVPNGGWVEVHSFPIAEWTVEGKVGVTEGWIGVEGKSPGVGVEFDWSRLERWEIAVAE
jgi:L-alanine-DL-glutamate epimerase-like enolase superfamily enzyme